MAPEKGRSALDAVEAMDNMVNMMREHISSDARVHYVITDGGKAPNVVPDFAEVYYVARHNDMRVLDDIWERIVNAARGAALGTGTTMDVDVISAVWNILPNEYLARLQQKNLERVGGVAYTADDKAFAERLQKTLIGTVPEVAQAGTVIPFGGFMVQSSSTDLGDVSWRVPTVELSAATWVPGHAGAFMAGGGGRRHGHRRQGHDGRREDDDAHDSRSVRRSAAHRESARRIQRQARTELRVPHSPRGTEAGAGLSQERPVTQGRAGSLFQKSMPPACWPTSTLATFFERDEIDDVDRARLRPDAFDRDERVAIVVRHGDAVHDFPRRRNARELLAASRCRSPTPTDRACSCR